MNIRAHDYIIQDLDSYKFIQISLTKLSIQ